LVRDIKQKVLKQMDVKQGLSGHYMAKNYNLNPKWTKVVHFNFSK
jgi:hypothetical protein